MFSFVPFILLLVICLMVNFDNTCNIKCK
jgi:hypothetical protein